MRTVTHVRASKHATCAVCGNPVEIIGGRVWSDKSAVTTCLFRRSVWVDTEIASAVEKQIALSALRPRASWHGVLARLDALIELRSRLRTEEDRLRAFLHAIPQRYGAHRDREIVWRLFDTLGLGSPAGGGRWTVARIAAHHGVSVGHVEDLRDRAISAMRGEPEHNWRDRAPLTRSRARVTSAAAQAVV
jgi:hypothetical protein